MNTLLQKQFKRMKREVEEETARGIGYFEGILEHIPSYPLSEAVKELALAGWITPHTDVIDVQNMIVTESIKWMNYQDFKEVAPYLFSYPREQREKDLLVRPVKISREYFEELQANAEELFHLKQDLLQINNQLDAKIQELEMDQLPNGDQVIGVDLEAEEVLLLRTSENAQVEEWEVRKDGLITDYRSNLSESAQIVEALLEMKNSEIDTILYEEVINYSKRTWPDSEPIQLPESIKEMLNQEAKLDPSYYQIAQFETLRQAYIYGMISPSFQEHFPHYSDFVRNYVEDREQYEFFDYRTEAVSLAQEILVPRLDDINRILSTNNQELIVQEVTGYSQGESWDLAYLRNTKAEDRESVQFYLENEIGAWYKGSLTELAVIRFEDIDPEKGFNGQQEAVYHIDDNLLLQDKLKQVQHLIPDLERFVEAEEVEKQLNQTQDLAAEKEASEYSL
ncbi:hypothetical protein [Streptococcus oralis]|jgi:hypothetical protein|uniref:Uncharacterized protein n=1 Tax=Streptococcus oralis subsp. dentisani TaxID=1458253 RepID=A0A1X1J0Q3_STROR|nr:hypothetical protein [Streptococcus oralis]MCY7075315.1 hypothetical protein [Streptococcus oralis]ORO76918.1 hypothetical protein B7707_08150 [Streptococcus oralis subsp. dentisani]ORO78863.1 hypothetical protein B7708_03750 [Streptococcus oralis subsp. dentisani]